MLFVNEAVEKVLIDEGQVLVPISRLKYDQYRLETMFVNTIKDYQQWCPVEVTEFMNVGNEGVEIPGVQRVLSVRYNLGGEYMQPVAPYLEEQYWKFYPNKKLYLTMPGTYEITYIRDVKIERPVYTYKEDTLLGNEVELEFLLPGIPMKGTLKVACGEDTIEWDADEEEYKGTLGTLEYDEQNGKTTITFEGSHEGDLMVEFRSKYKATPDISLGDPLFMKMFAATLMTGLGALKKQLTLEELPFDLSIDDLLTRGRELKAEAEAEKANLDNWFLQY